MKTPERTPIALITGGSRGLGRSMALHLAERGVDIVFTYRAAASEANDVKQQIEALGRKAVALKLDVAESDSFEAFARTVAGELERTWGRKQFDYLVNNAGMGLHAPIVESTSAQLDQIYSVHFQGPLLAHSTPAAPDGRRWSRHQRLERTCAYDDARFRRVCRHEERCRNPHALHGQRARSAQDHGQRRCPGAIATDFSGGMVRDNPELNRTIASMTALGRVGQADDVGGAVAMLLSPESGWINGQRIEVSGGQGL